MYSKVIKGFVWQEDKYRIEVPTGKPEEEDTDEDADEEEDFDDEDEEEEKKPAYDEEAVNNMMAEIAAKEQRAIEKLKDADVRAEILIQEAQAEADKIKQAATEEAEALRAAAKDETEKLRADTTAECEEIKTKTTKTAHDEGYKKGHDEGYAAGHEEGIKAATEEMKDRMKESVEYAEHVLQTAKEATGDYLLQAEQDFAEVVMRVVEKVIPQHFIDVPQVILPAVRQALAKVRDQKEIIIHVAPDCYDFVLMARDEFRAMLTGGNANLEVQSDESLKPGDCLLETPNGSVDARLQTQLEMLKEAVKGVLAKEIK